MTFFARAPDVTAPRRRHVGLAVQRAGPTAKMSMASDFYLRYYVGHKGKFGHEFLEFEFRPDGERRRGREGGRAPSGWVSISVLPFCVISVFLFGFESGVCVGRGGGLVV